jgi:serine/threonine protein kinase
VRAGYTLPDGSKTKAKAFLGHHAQQGPKAVASQRRMLCDALVPRAPRALRRSTGSISVRYPQNVLDRLSPVERTVVEYALHQDYVRPEQVRAAMARRRLTGEDLMVQLAGVVDKKHLADLSKALASARAVQPEALPTLLLSPNHAAEYIEHATVASPAPAVPEQEPHEPSAVDDIPTVAVPFNTLSFDAVPKKVALVPPASPSSGHSTLPLVIGRYKIVREIARGGMGIVYEAHDPNMGRRVAIKRLISDDSSKAHMRRFQREARAVAALPHPHVVRIFEIADDEKGAYIVMAFVEGRSLQDRIRDEGPLSPKDAVRLSLALAQALHFAHGHGILHRDMKPHNVLLTTDGEPRITDFGVAKVANLRETFEAEDPEHNPFTKPQAEASLTMTGHMLGTPSYMPPEQANGELRRMGPQVDVYGLGATLYAMLTGGPPFTGDSLVELLYELFDTPAEAPSARNPEVDPALDEICLRCLAKEPEERYPSAEALGQALQAYLDTPFTLVPAPVPVPVAVPTPGGGSRSLGVGAIALTSLVGFLVVGVMLGSPSGSSEVASSPPEDSIPLLPPPSASSRPPPATGRPTPSASSVAPVPSAAPSASPVASPVKKSLDPAVGRLFQSAQEAVARGRFAQALTALDQAVEQSSNAPEALGRRAQLRARLWDLSGALQDLDKTVARSPTPKWLASRARLHRLAGRLKQAWEDAERALAACSTPAERGACRLERANTLIEEGRLDVARQELNRVEGLEAEDHGLAETRGLLALAEGRTEEAVRQFAKSGNTLTALVGTGRALLAQGNSFDAERVLSQLLSIWPRALPGLVERARAREKLRHRADARADWLLVLELEPGHPGAVEGLARLDDAGPSPVTSPARERGASARVKASRWAKQAAEETDRARGLQLCDRALRMDPKCRNAYMVRALIHEQEREWVSTLEDLRGAAALGQPSNELVERIAKVRKKALKLAKGWQADEKTARRLSRVLQLPLLLLHLGNDDRSASLDERLKSLSGLLKGFVRFRQVHEKWSTNTLKRERAGFDPQALLGLAGLPGIRLLDPKGRLLAVFDVAGEDRVDWKRMLAAALRPDPQGWRLIGVAFRRRSKPPSMRTIMLGRSAHKLFRITPDRQYRVVALTVHRADGSEEILMAEERDTPVLITQGAPLERVLKHSGHTARLNLSGVVLNNDVTLRIYAKEK